MRFFVYAIPLLAAFVLAGQAQSATELAGTVYTNGKIYSVNGNEPWAEALAIKDGKFLKVGSNQEVSALAATMLKGSTLRYTGEEKSIACRCSGTDWHQDNRAHYIGYAP